MADTDGTTTPRKGRPFPIPGEGVDLIVTIQGRTTPKLTQQEVIMLGLRLADKHTAHLRPTTKSDLVAEIVGS